MHDEPYYQVPLVRGDGSLRDITVIDYADALSVAVYRWSKNPNGYAVRHVHRGPAVLMHRQLLGLQPGDGLEVDHINRDRLDNRRSNLRRSTRAQNALNLGSYQGSTSIYRGVQWQRDKMSWRARPRFEGAYHHLGYFADEDAAGRAVHDFFVDRGVDYPMPVSA